MKELLHILGDNIGFLCLLVGSFFKGFRRIFVGALASTKTKTKYFMRLAYPYFRALKSKGFIIFGAVCLLLTVGVVFLLELTADYYLVSYKDKNLGYTRSSVVVSATVEKLQEQFKGNVEIVNDLSLVKATEIQTNQLFLACLSAKELQDAIVNSSDRISYGYSVYIEGERRFISTSHTTVNNAIEDYKQDRVTLNKNIYAGYESCEVSFLNNVEVIKECVDNAFLTKADIYKSLYALLEAEAEYKIICIQTENVAIPYMASYSRNNSLPAGVKKVVQNGQNGVRAIRKQLVIENGEVISSTALSGQVVKNPVTRKVEVGSDTAAMGGLDSNLGLLLPTEGRVSSNFGDRDDPFTGEHANHTGLDIAAKTGTPIIAAASGKVIQASDKRNGYGKCVIIEHYSGFRTLYAHCSALHVEVGDYVEAGELIADVGSTGRSTGPHLHFSIIIDGKFVDPSLYF